MKYLPLTLILAAVAAPLACDTAEPAEPADFRELQIVAAELPASEYAGKIIRNCITAELPATMTLAFDQQPGEPQSFTFTIESAAPAAEVECIATVLQENQ